MWLADERYDFLSDSAEKKRIARGAHNRVTKGGRARFSTDYMTTKEIKAMNGAINEYNLNKPMEWKTFKAMPDDLKIQYIKSLREAYGANDTQIAKMFGVSGWTLSALNAELGISLGKKGARPILRRGPWEEFLGISEKEELKSLDQGPAPAPTPVEAKETKPAPVLVTAVPKGGSLTFEGKANDSLRALQMLLANENVRLYVSWDIIVENEENEHENNA